MGYNNTAIGYNNMGYNNMMNPQMNMYNIQQGPYPGYTNTSNIYQQRKSTPFDL